MLTEDLHNNARPPQEMELLKARNVLGTKPYGLAKGKGLTEHFVISKLRA